MVQQRIRERERERERESYERGKQTEREKQMCIIYQPTRGTHTHNNCSHKTTLTHTHILAHSQTHR